MQNSIPAEIPAQILNEVYKCIATRHEVEVGKLDRTKVGEAEFIAALSYHQGAPLIEASDIDEELLASCRNLSRELDIAALEDYKFVPMAMRGQVLVVISVCPWEPTTPEVVGSYFQQCGRVRFMLISRGDFDSLIAKLKATGAAQSTVAGYAPKTAAPKPVVPPPAVPLPAEARVAVPPAQKAAVTRTAPAVPARPDAQAAADPKAKVAEVIGTLNHEEVSYLVNLVVSEGQKIIQRKQQRPL